MRILAYLGLIADIVTIWVFVSGKKFTEFWSMEWVISIALIIALFMLAMTFLKKSENSTEEVDTIMAIFGIGYTILGIALYIYFAYIQATDYINLYEYGGYWALFSIMYLISLYCVIKIDLNSLLLQSYAYGAAILYVMILLIYKYVYNSDIVDLAILLQELGILVVGSIIFFTTY